MASRPEGMGKDRTAKKKKKTITEQGEFQEALSRAATACLLALPTPLDQDDEDNEHRADPEADKRILVQLESGPKAL